MLSEFRGRMLNHGETLYQRGERELAIQFYEALGCEVVDTHTPCETGSTILYAFPDPDEHDRLNNVLYLSEIRDQQWDLEEALADRLSHDAELAATFESYRLKARTAPHGIPHFGLRSRRSRASQQCSIGSRTSCPRRSRTESRYAPGPRARRTLTPALLRAA